MEREFNGEASSAARLGPGDLGDSVVGVAKRTEYIVLAFALP